MKTFLIIVVLLIAAIVVYFFILGIHSRSKDAPGLIGGQLAKCPDTPNCFCTEYMDHKGHYLEPIHFPQTMRAGIDAMVVIREIITEMGGKIQHQKENYLAATFSSAIFGFVDDFEVRIDTGIDQANKIIHLRSASRVGRSDLGVNKKRIDLFKKLFEKKISINAKKDEIKK